MKMHVLRADDWAGLFVDGVLFEENHQVRVEDLISASKGQPFTLEETCETAALYAHLENHGRFVGTLEEILAENAEVESRWTA